MISKGLLLKSGAGLATAAASGTGMYYVFDYFGNQSTKFDRGLIDYLRDGGKIQFAVSDGNGTLSADFPAFATGHSALTVTVKIKTNPTNSTTDGKLIDKKDAKSGDKGHKDSLKKLNSVGSGNDWTWICEIKFNKDNGSVVNFADEYKDKLFKDQSKKGFFNRLKEEDNKNENKDLKIKFIRNCAKERGENKKINDLSNLSSMTPTNEIKFTKEFDLRVGNGGEKTDKLYPVNKSDFDHWFS